MADIRCLALTAADAHFFDFAKACITSIRDKPEAKEVTIGFFDLGCNDAQIDWMRNHVDLIQEPDWDYQFPLRDKAPSYLRGLLARPFLQKYFPDFDVYFWMDADAWLQDWSAAELFLQGAVRRRGMAIVPEIDRGSLFQFGRLNSFFKSTFNWYSASYGEEVAKRLCSYPLLNAGVFALHREAPHWKAWEKSLGEALQRTVSLITDQMAINHVIYDRGLFGTTELLPAWCNWTCHIGLPRWDCQQQSLVEPYLPHSRIGILHLTKPFPNLRHTPSESGSLRATLLPQAGNDDQKVSVQRLLTLKGQETDVMLRYPPHEVASDEVHDNGCSVKATEEGCPAPSPAPTTWDYVSPNLKCVSANRFFPHLHVGDQSECNWAYLRRNVPHTWYVDGRTSSVGFVSRDEAHLLYNNALSFRGKQALEIGCWMGWSACHLALAGVELDIIDPVLANQEIQKSVVASLQAALDSTGQKRRIRLHPTQSPQQVDQLGHQGMRWSLFFIDGDHESPGPLRDAQACEKYAEDDAMTLFHDLAAPAVAQGLDYYRQRGWNTMVYQTKQIMGVAWRGNVKPVEHEPDPQVNWSLPDHLSGYHISRIAP